MLCEEETPKSQRVEEESKESSSSSSEEDEGEDEASESEAEKEAGDPEAIRPQSAGGRHVSEGRWSQPWGTDSQTGAPDRLLLPSHHVKPLQMLVGDGRRNTILVTLLTLDDAQCVESLQFALQ